MAEPIIKPVLSGFEPVGCGQFHQPQNTWSLISAGASSQAMTSKNLSLYSVFRLMFQLFSHSGLTGWVARIIDSGRDGKCPRDQMQDQLFWMTYSFTYCSIGTLKRVYFKKPPFVHQKHHHIGQWIDKHLWWSHVPLFLHSDWMLNWQTAKIQPQLFLKISPLGQSNFSSATFQNSTIFIFYDRGSTIVDIRSKATTSRFEDPLDDNEVETWKTW